METFTHQMFIVAFFIFLGYYVVLAVYYLVLGLVGFAVGHQRGEEDAEEDYRLLAASSFTLPVSIILPAHNEEAWIADSLQSLLNLNYPEFEIVVVDDCSTDRTLEILKERLELVAVHNPYTDHFQSGRIRGLFKSARHPHVTVLSKENGQKKARAVNAGLNLARYKYVCFVDADTVLDPDALMRVMAQVEKDPDKIIGVGSYFGLVNGFEVEHGNVVGKNFLRPPLVAYQDLEYLRSFIGNRLSWSRWNATPIIAGGFAVWRRDVLLEMGGFNADVSCEDIELTFRAHEYMVQHREAGYRIEMLPYVVGWTEGPHTIRNLIGQRNRWHRATMETTWKFRHMLCNPRYGKFGFLTVPYFFLYEVLGIFFELGSIAVTILGFLSGVFDLKLLVGFLVFMTLFQSCSSLLPLVAFHREQKLYRPAEFGYLVLLSLVEFAVYRWITMVARVTGTIDFFRGVRTGESVPRARSSSPPFAISVALQRAKV
jgi:cellulose synthase/poly-beta-1,6-N-acetylglucosamine synthase-like glycosyltransferase